MKVTKCSLNFLFIFFHFFILSSCTLNRFFFQPSPYDYSEPGLSKEEIFLTGEAGQIALWVMKPKDTKSKGIIVQFHGNAQNMTAHYQSLHWMVKEGYTLIVFDYRGYGISQGVPSDKGAVSDAKIVMNFVLNTYEKKLEEKLIFFGQSLGGAIMMKALEDEFEWQKKISLIVMDSTFLSYKQVASEVVGKNLITAFFFPVVWLMTSDQMSAKNSIGTLITPLLILHDRYDPIIYYKNALNIYQAARLAPKQLWWERNGYHIGYFLIEKNRQRFSLLLSQLKTFKTLKVDEIDSF